MRRHRTAQITGASGGLGLEFAKILAKKKYDLVLLICQLWMQHWMCLGKYGNQLTVVMRGIL